MAYSPSRSAIRGAMIQGTLDRFSLIKWCRTRFRCWLSLKFVLIPGLLAAAAWSGWSILLLPAALILPMTLGVAQSKRQAFLGAFSYFCGALWPVIPGTMTFFRTGELVSG